MAATSTVPLHSIHHHEHHQHDVHGHAHSKTHSSNCHCPLPTSSPTKPQRWYDTFHISLGIAGTYGVSSATSGEFGFLQQGGHDPSDTGFDFQQVELAIDGAINDQLAGFAHWSISDHIETEYAFLHFKDTSRHLTVRAIYLPLEIGWNNLQHGHKQQWLDRSVSDARLIGKDTPRSAGLHLGWRPFEHLGVLAGVFANDDDTLDNWRGSGHSHNLNDLPTALGNWDNQPADAADKHGADDLVWLARLDWTHSHGKAGASLTWGENGTGDNTHTTLANSFFNIGRDHWKTHAEITYRHATTPNDTLKDWGATAEVHYNGFVQTTLALRLELLSGAGDSFGPTARNRDPARDDRIRISPLISWKPWPEMRLRAQINWDDSSFQEQQHVSVLFGVELNIGTHGHASRY